MHGHPDGGRAHGVLADAVVHLAAARVLGALVAGVVGQLDAGVAGQVGGARHEAGERGRSTAPSTLAIAWRVASSSPCSNVGSGVLPALRAGAAPTPRPRRPARRRRARRAPPASAALASRHRARRRRRGRSSTTSAGAQNGSSGMPMHLLGARDVLGGERVAVGRRVVGVVGRRACRCASAARAGSGGSRRPGRRAARPPARRSRRRPRRGTRRASRRPRSAAPTSSEFDSSVGAVDRDPVVVEDADQPAEAEVAGQRGRLVADALHEAAVAGDDVGVVVDERRRRSARAAPARRWPCRRRRRSPARAGRS